MVLSHCSLLPTPSDPRFTALEPGEELAGGATTVFDTGPNAFAFSARNMSAARRTDFLVGNSFFEQNWVIAPASTQGRDGLGPLFNARSCSSCHLHDGRGRPPRNQEGMVSMLLRLSIPGQDPHGGPLPHPTYGDQLNERSVPGVPGEAETRLSYTEVPGTYADGTPYRLRRPQIEIHNWAYQAPSQALAVSPRVAPAMIGLGLLESISEADLLTNVDEADADGDGVSGRANFVWDAAAGAHRLGRFGWKANQPNLRQQTAGAFLGDIGITSELFSAENCGEGQDDCAKAPNGGQPELSESMLDQVTFYSQTLAVPARRDADAANVLAGKKLFYEAKCTACHVPSYTTPVREDFPELSNQKIWPYTDLLLHDMGEALADHRADYRADGREWRTPPLWGIGLLETVSGHMELLHDGRARGVAEAVLWHGGEAAAARERFRAMSATERANLVAFVKSL
ncbi:di-heme oxidoreductase family protein [Acanthopleuribacter pedis]